MDFKGTTLSEKAYLKRYTLFDSIYITSLKWQNYTNGGQISGCQGLGMEGGGEGVWMETRKEVSGIIKGQHKGFSGRR